MVVTFMDRLYSYLILMKKIVFCIFAFAVRHSPFVPLYCWIWTLLSVVLFMILSVCHLIFESAHFSFQAQILALVHCACVPDINSVACNALIDFSFSFSHEV
jgi:hypothetical protein